MDQFMAFLHKALLHYITVNPGIYITLTAEQKWMLHCDALAGCLTSSYYLLNEVTHEQIWRYKRAKTARSLGESSLQN